VYAHCLTITVDHKTEYSNCSKRCKIDSMAISTQLLPGKEKGGDERREMGNKSSDERTRVGDITPFCP